MTRVLLITDTERVQRIFQSLEKDGVLQLRTATTLAPGDLELGEPAPELIFAQSRISGFSSEIALRRLQNILPPQSKVVLLAVDEDDAAQAGKHGSAFLDLAADDNALGEAIRNLVAGGTPAVRKKGAKPEAAPARKGRPPKEKPSAAAVEAASAGEGAKTRKRAPARRKTRAPLPLEGAEAAAPLAAESAVALPAQLIPPELPVEEIVPVGEAGAVPGEPVPKLPSEETVSEHAAAETPVGAAPRFFRAEEQRGEPELVPEEPAPAVPVREVVSISSSARARVTEAGPAAGGGGASVEKAAPTEGPAVERTAAEAAGAAPEGLEEGAAPPPPRRPGRGRRKIAPAPVAEVEVAEAPTFSPTRLWISEEPPADLPEEAPVKPPPEPKEEVPEEKVDTFANMMRRASERQTVEAPLPQPSPEAERAEFAHAGSTVGPVPLREAIEREPEPLTNGMIRAEKKPFHWIVALAVALLLIPVLFFGLGRLQRHKQAKKTPTPTPAPAFAPSPAPPARRPAVEAAKPATAPSAQAVKPAAPAARQAAPAMRALPPTAPPAVPAAHPARAPATQPAPPPSPKPAPARGLAALPPFLAGVTIDRSYGKNHPGWERYLGARAEYKLYREGDRYKALQVLALPAQSISDEIYQRALLEFGGIDSYHIQSRERKGPFVIEHGAAKGDIGLTIYRKKSDLSMKGLVIFYQ